jgi:hypothetical protein
MTPLKLVAFSLMVAKDELVLEDFGLVHVVLAEVCFGWERRRSWLPVDRGVPVVCRMLVQWAWREWNKNRLASWDGVVKGDQEHSEAVAVCALDGGVAAGPLDVFLEESVLLLCFFLRATQEVVDEAWLAVGPQVLEVIFASEESRLLRTRDRNRMRLGRGGTHGRERAREKE